MCFMLLIINCNKFNSFCSWSSVCSCVYSCVYCEAFDHTVMKRKNTHLVLFFCHQSLISNLIDHLVLQHTDSVFWSQTDTTHLTKEEERAGQETCLIRSDLDS